MDYCIYHSRDLDGLTSGAIIYAHQKQFGELVNIVGYDYGQKLDTRRFKGKITTMIDVSMSMDRMETLGLGCLEFIWIDHHVSAFNDLKEYCELKGHEIKNRQINGLITCYEVLGMNMIYYYSERLSGCEIAAALYAQKLGTNARTLISMLGQYDTWRKEEENKFVKDKDWNKEVLPAQWAMRIHEDPIEIFKVLVAIDDWATSTTLESILTLGASILRYQQIQYMKAMEQCSFEFNFNDLRVLAINAQGFGSVAFDCYFYEEIHDLMMSFFYSGKTNMWNVSLYTTKDDVDILSIAKSFGGGGHKKACGFKVPGDELRFFKGSVDIGKAIILDIASLPQDFDFDDKKQIDAILKAMRSQPLLLVPAKKEFVPKETNDIKLEDLIKETPAEDIDVIDEEVVANGISSWDSDNDDDTPFEAIKPIKEKKLADTITGNVGWKYNVRFAKLLMTARAEGRLIKLSNGNWDCINATEEELEILNTYGKV